MSSHIFYKCPQPCEKTYCQYCEGGLALCTVCNCGEGTLPTECPGKKVGEGVQESIFRREIDFKNGQWVTCCSDCGENTVSPKEFVKQFVKKLPNETMVEYIRRIHGNHAADLYIDKLIDYKIGK